MDRIGKASEAVMRGLTRGANGGTLRRWPVSEAVEASGVRWVCAQAERAQDVFGLIYDLSRAGFRAYAPEVVRVAYRPRVRGAQVRTKALRCEPVFGAYLFVGQPEGLWLAKSSHRRLAGILGAGTGQYAPVPARVIKAVSAADLAGAWDERRDAKGAGFAVGELVRLVEGPFEGLAGAVESVDALRGIIRVGISRVVVTVRACQLERA